MKAFIVESAIKNNEKSPLNVPKYEKPMNTHPKSKKEAGREGKVSKTKRSYEDKA